MNSSGQNRPPRWASRFLAWYCNPQLAEQIIGDAEELFYWRLEEVGYSKAKRAFVWDVLRFFRWRNIKRKGVPRGFGAQNNNITMLKNYLKIGWRNIVRQKMPSTINILGLSIAISCCLVAYIYVESRWVVDNFHENGDNIYLVTHSAMVDGNQNRYGHIDVSMGDVMEDRFPVIKHRIRFSGAPLTVKSRGNLFSEHVTFVDPAFLQSFTFPLVEGEETALYDPSRVILDEYSARRYFGDENPIGETLTFLINDELRAFVVGAVYKTRWSNTSLRPGVLLSFEVLKQMKGNQKFNAWTFVELQEGTSVIELSQKLQELIPSHNNASSDYDYDEINLEPLTTMASNSGIIRNSPGGGRPGMAPFILVSLIAAFMLMLSVSNYVNISVLMGTKRIKEIGVRKVVGGRRMQLVNQFLVENLILCVLAIVVGCFLAKGVLMPGFNEISGSSLTVDVLTHRSLWKFLIVLTAFVTLLSGAYPAFYISKFKPTVIFSGKQKMARNWRFSGILITFQFVLSIITIVAGVMFVATNKVNADRDWGFNQNGKVVVPVPGTNLRSAWESKLLALPGVEGLTGSRENLASVYSTRQFSLNNNKAYAVYLECAPDYMQFMEVALRQGRFFDKTLLSDLSSSVLINESFASRYGVGAGQDQLLQLGDDFYKIVGVVGDFHYRSFGERIEPMVIKAVPDSLITQLTLAVAQGREQEIEDKARIEWLSMVEDRPYGGYVFTKVWRNYFEDMQGLQNVMLFTAILAILLSAMGLFGLASLSITSRMKDFGIKKVLGASLLQITKSVYIRFAVMLGIAIVTGGTLSVLIIGLLLDVVYGYHEPINAWPLLFSGLLLAIIAFSTISTQMRKVKKLNPAETLRME